MPEEVSTESMSARMPERENSAAFLFLGILVLEELAADLIILIVEAARALKESTDR